MRSSLHILFLLSLSSTTLAATNLIPHKPPARLLAQLVVSPSSHFRDASVVIAAQCRPGELICNSGCMPSIAECCSDGQGYCKQGYSCVTDGCCPIGHTCSDEITCDLGEVPCGDKKCMPKGAVCCPGGSYCQAGEECFQNGFNQYCQRVDGSGNPDDGGGSKTTGGTVGISKTTSSRRQSTLSSKTTDGEASASASTSAETQTDAETTSAKTQTDAETTAQTDAETTTSTLISTSTSSRSASSILTIPDHPIVTPFLPILSTTSATTTEFISSSTAATTATTTSGGIPATVKMPGVMMMALIWASIITMSL